MLSTEVEKSEKGGRSERLATRLNASQKALLERAAALHGQTLSSFVLASAEEAAIRTIREHETIALTARDRAVFTAALLDPPQPSAKLRAAAARHKSRMGL